MDPSEVAYQRSRQLTDELKHEVRTLVVSWFERADTKENPTALIAALGESTAELGVSMSSPTITVGILLDLAVSLNNAAIMAGSAPRHAPPMPQ